MLHHLARSAPTSFVEMITGMLIVDDVYTTGGSLDGFRGDRNAIDAVVFARQEPLSWITPLFVKRVVVQE